MGRKEDYKKLDGHLILLKEELWEGRERGLKVRARGT